MTIHGLNKTTLLDYPGKVAATIFLGGCNLRCPFCQNSSLIVSPESEPIISFEQVVHFLKKRKRILDGVCISGGEPTIHKELVTMIKQIHELGYSIKLDTNGTHPEVIEKLIHSHLIHMVAMDIKSSKETYSNASGIKELDLLPIMESVNILMDSNMPYEFRTTVVRELHTENDFHSISNWLAGCNAYYLQAFRDSTQVLMPGFSSYTLEEMNAFKRILLKTIPTVGLRGID